MTQPRTGEQIEMEQINRTFLWAMTYLLISSQCLATLIKNKDILDTKPTSESFYFDNDHNRCEWPKYSTGMEALPCNFRFIPIKTLKNGNIIVTLPSGTRLYRSEYIPIGNRPTLELKNFKLTLRLKGNNGLWFASNEYHANWHHSKNTMLTYELKKDAKLVFIPNLANYMSLKKKLNKTQIHTGKNFEKSSYFKKYRQKYLVNGYMGCNECEIYLNSAHLMLYPLEKISSVPKDSNYFD